MYLEILPVVYFCATNEAERDALYNVFLEYCWSVGEHGMMLTDVAFRECVQALPEESPKWMTQILEEAARLVNSWNAGDVCLNIGIFHPCKSVAASPHVYGNLSSR